MKTAKFIAALWLSLVTLPHAQTQTTPASTPKTITKENTIYVPFEKLEDVFAGQEQGVFLPYREFLEMWNKLNLPENIKNVEPPVEGVLAGAQYTGRVTGGVAEIKAKLNFEALKEGWSSLQLGTGDLALAETKTTAYLSAGDSGHEIIFPNKGSYSLEATIFGRVSVEKGVSTLTLRLPKTAVSQFELLVPDKSLEFTITPASAFSAIEQEGGTKLAVYFGASQDITISWIKKGGETTLPALLFSDVQTNVRLSAGAVRSDVTTSYRVLRAGVNMFDITVPVDQQVLSVEGQNIRDWKTSTEGDTQKIHVELHTPAKDNYSLAIKLESALPPLPQTLKIPLITTLGVERQSGTVNVFGEGDLFVEVSELQGLSQQSIVRAKDAPVPVGSYRHLRLPYAGVIKVSEAKPQIEVSSLTLLTVGIDQLTLNAKFDYLIKKAGVFDVTIGLPEIFSNAVATGPMVETSTITTTDAGSVMNVRFKQRVSGDLSFNITSEVNRAKPDEPLVVPAFSPAGVERHDARIGLAIHVSLKANTAEKGDFLEEDIRNLAGMPVQDPAKSPLTLGFRYRTQADKTAAPAKLSFELRKPRVSAEVFALVDVREALTRHSWIINYHVDFAGVDDFRIEVPKAIADDIQIEGANIKERIKTELNDEKGQPNGKVEMRVVLQDKVLGDYRITFFHDGVRGEQKAGVVQPVALQEVKALNVFRETGQIAVIKDGNLEFTKTVANGLEVMDPKELRPELQRDGIFLAYKYSQHPLALNLDVSKNFYLEVPQAVVTYAVLTSVIAEDQAETTEVIYWVKNNSQQFFSVQLPSRGDKQARLLSDAFVAGEPQQPGKRPDKNEVLIRLPAKQANNTEFPVRFVYEVPSPNPGKKLGFRGNFKLDPPQLADVKVLQSKWTLYLPTTHRYAGFGGSMREEMGQRGWERVMRGIRLFVPQIGPPAPPSGTLQRSEPPELPTARTAGFDTQLRLEGMKTGLRRMDAPAAVEVAFRGKTYSFLVEAMLGILGFAGGIYCLRRNQQERWAYFIFVGLGALVISGVVNPRSAAPWQTLAFGVLGAAFIWIVPGIFRWIAGFAKRRREAAAAKNAPTSFPVHPPAPAAPPVKPASDAPSKPEDGHDY